MCIRRSVGRSWKANPTWHPYGASLPPKWHKQDQRDSGVSAVVWEGVGS